MKILYGIYSNVSLDAEHIQFFFKCIISTYISTPYTLYFHDLITAFIGLSKQTFAQLPIKVEFFYHLTVFF